MNVNPARLQYLKYIRSIERFSILLLKLTSKLLDITFKYLSYLKLCIENSVKLLYFVTFEEQVELGRHEFQSLSSPTQSTLSTWSFAQRLTSVMCSTREMNNLVGQYSKDLSFRDVMGKRPDQSISAVLEGAFPTSFPGSFLPKAWREEGRSWKRSWTHPQTLSSTLATATPKPIVLDQAYGWVNEIV